MASDTSQCQYVPVDEQWKHSDWWRFHMGRVLAADSTLGEEHTRLTAGNLAPLATRVLPHNIPLPGEDMASNVSRLSTKSKAD